MAITLTVTSKGRITLREEMLAHLDARAGDKLDVDLLADERMQVRSRRATSAAAVFGMLVKPQALPLGTDEMNEVAAFDHAAVARLRAQGANAVAPADLVA